MPPKSHQTGDFVQAQAGPELYSLGLGQPTPRLLPQAIVAESASALAQIDPLFLQYNRSDGAQSLRRSIAHLVQSHRNRPIDPESLLISNGNSQAVDWVATTLSSAGDTIVCENPTYFLAASIFHDAALKVHPVKVDAQGLDVTQLEADLKSGLRPKWLYCIPAHHNPTGVSLGPERVLALIELARRFDFLVVFDDPYTQLHFGASSFCALDQVELDPAAPWIRLSSFSKIFAPGLRLGWIEAPTPVKAQLLRRGMLKSGGGLNPVSGAIVSRAIESGALEQHRDLIRAALQQRAQVVQQTLATEMPDCRLWPVSGGYFGWLQWPEGFDARAFARHCKTQGLHFLAGELACIDESDKRRNFGRISLSFYEAEELREAMVLMGRCYREFSSTP